MNFKKKTFCLIIYLTAILFSCTTTTTRIINPVFIDQTKVQSELNSIVKAENINIQGKEITKNLMTSTEIEVSITNGQGIPTGQDQQKVLERSIARCIKKNLKDPDEFDSYKIVFVEKVRNNGTTKKSWTGNIFKPSEL